MKMRLAVVAVSVLAATGCGVQVDDSPREIPASDVPPGLLSSSTTMPPDSSAVETTTQPIYLVNDSNRLVAVDRQIVSPASVGNLLAALMQGPTDEESSNGLRSTVIPQASIVGVQPVGDTALVSVSDEFRSIPAQDQIRALAQIVFTATDVEGIQSVQVQVNQEPAEVPRGDGSVTSAPLTRLDYGAFAPE
jgi:spore germination protein GerM